MKRLGLLLVLAACAHVSPVDRLDAMLPVTCDTDCDTKWARAARWIDENSHWKLRLDTPDLLETYGGNDTFVAYRVRRMPHEIVVTTACVNYGLGCNPPEEQARARLKRYIATGK